jgi:hypothetical protein
MDVTENNKIKLIKNDDFNSSNGTDFFFKNLTSNFGPKYNTAQAMVDNKNGPVFSCPIV